MSAPAFPPPFALRLIDWQKTHGRHGLPWQNTRDPYRVWLSEIMLQQTQVETVIPYYQRFLQRFPDVAALAAAPVDEVLALWSGLGYYARARNLHRAAQRVVAQHGGEFPCSAAALAELPGIGRSTAAAIAAFCFGERAAILDGNVKRVLARHFGIEGFPGERAVEQRLWAVAEAQLPAAQIEVYTQAMMDLGATLCTRGKPACLHCPVAGTCMARASGRADSLPTPRPPRSTPQREAAMLVLRCRGAVWLERRPPQGIWGGLYSLPELVAGQTPAAWLQGRFGMASISEVRALPAVRHSFTHFTLTITPWLLDVPTLTATVEEPDGRWVDENALAGLGLPAPIRRLLDALPEALP